MTTLKTLCSKILLLQCTQHGSQKKHSTECWEGSGFGIDITGTRPVLIKKKIQEISYQTLQGQGKGPTVGMKRDRVKRKKAGTKKLHVV